MAFEPNYEKLVTSYRKSLTTSQAQVDVKLATTDGSEVKTILSSSAKSHGIKTEVNGNTINYNGLVNFQVIYESALGEVFGLDYTAEFVDKYCDDEVNNIFMPVCESKVVDVDLNMINPTTIQVTAVLENRIDGIFNETTNSLVDIKGENIYTMCEKQKFNTFIGNLNEKYELVNDVEINESISKILSVTPSVCIDEVLPNTNFASVKGNVFVDLTYLTNDEKPLIRSLTKTIDFNMEVSLDGLTNESYIQSDIYVNSSDIKITTNLDLEKAIINLMLPITYNGYAFNCVELETVKDLYSTENELNITSSSVNSILPSETLMTTEQINGSVMVNDSFVDEILGNSCNNVTVTSTFIEDDMITVEGIANTTVIYYCKEEDSKNSIIVEIPFSIRTKGNELKNDFKTVVNACVSDISTKSKRGQEIEVFAKLYLYMNVYGLDTNCLISNVELGDEIEPNNCAIKIYIVKDNETLWDVAKELGTSISEITKQNPELELPIKAGDRIYIYYQKVKEF